MNFPVHLLESQDKTICLLFDELFMCISQLNFYRGGLIGMCLNVVFWDQQLVTSVLPLSHGCTRKFTNQERSV